MLLLSRPVVVSLLDPDELRNAVSAAMAELSSGKVSMPSRIAARVDSAQALLAAMPAYSASGTTSWLATSQNSLT